MKKHFSVFLLMVRASFWKVLALLALLCAVEYGLFLRTFRSLCPTGELLVPVWDVLSQTPLTLAFKAAFLLLAAVLVLPGCKLSSQPAYLLMRLQVHPRFVVLWQALYNALCLLLLMLVQVLFGLFLAWRCAAFLPQPPGPQSLFFTVTRTKLLYTLLPFENAALLLFCCAWLLCGGMVLAALSHFHRLRGSFAFFCLLGVGIMLLGFPRSFYSADNTATILNALLLLLILCIETAMIWNKEYLQ